MLDAVTLRFAGDAYPFGVPDGAAFMVVTEADGAVTEAGRIAAELQEALAEDAVAVHAPTQPTFFYDLGSPVCYLVAERISSALPTVADPQAAVHGPYEP